MAYYAWGPIKGGTAEDPVTIERGDTVTKDKLGVSDADWNEFVQSGAIRDKEFPAPKGYEGSVIDYLREKLEEAQAMSAVDVEEVTSELAAVSAGTTAAPVAAAPAETSAEKSTSGKK